MKHENEFVDARIMVRIMCGILAAGATWAFVSAVLDAFSQRPYDWEALFLPLASLFGLVVFGRYALTGRLPSFMTREKLDGPA